MRKKISFLLITLFLFSGLTACAPQSQPIQGTGYRDPRKFIITDQKNRSLSIYDLNDSDWSAPDWTWTCNEKAFTSVDGVKYRNNVNLGGDVIAFCSSGGYTAIISYPQGETLAYIPDAGGNPHSVEILPDGALVLASSADAGYVRIYDTSGFGDISRNYTEVTLTSAHGVLWDPDLEVLWALGQSQLKAYEVTEDHQMIEIDSMTVGLPSSGGHDLQPVYGDRDLLWVTTNSNIYQIRKSTGEASILYPGGPSISATSAVKGIGNFLDGTVIFAQASNVEQEWNTDTVHVATLNEDENRYYFEERKIPGVAYYKLRVFEKSYLGPQSG